MEMKLEKKRLEQKTKRISAKLIKLLKNKGNIGVYHNESFDKDYDNLLFWADRTLDDVYAYEFNLHSKEFYKDNFNELNGYIYFDLKESNKNDIKLSVSATKNFKIFITITYFIYKEKIQLPKNALLPLVIPTTFILNLRKKINDKYDYPPFEKVMKIL